MKNKINLLALPVLLTAVSAQADVRTYECKTATSTIDAVVDYSAFPVQITSLKIGGKTVNLKKVKMATYGGAPYVTVPRGVNGKDLFFTLNKLDGDIYQIGTDPNSYPMSCKIELQKPAAPAPEPEF